MKHYVSLNELPIWHFFQVRITGDLVYLLKLDNYDELPSNVPEEIIEKLREVWDFMDTESLVIFGVSSRLTDKTRAKNDIIKLELEDLGNEDPVIQNILATLKSQYNAAWGFEEGDDIKPLTLSQELAVVNKYVGFQIVPKTTSTVEYYSYVNKMHEEYEAQRMKNIKNGR